MKAPVIPSLLLAALCAPGAEGETPVAVSPGHSDDLAQVEGRCPTFNWGAVPGAESYQLVVHRLSDEETETRPVLQTTVPGSALGWTPSLEQCLERGGRYAWSVRARGPEISGEWSAPSLFQVTPGPSEAEFEEALQIVRRYLGGSSARLWRADDAPGASSGSGSGNVVLPAEPPLASQETIEVPCCSGSSIIVGDLAWRNYVIDPEKGAIGARDPLNPGKAELFLESEGGRVVIGHPTNDAVTYLALDGETSERASSADFVPEVYQLTDLTCRRGEMFIGRVSAQPNQDSLCVCLLVGGFFRFWCFNP